MVLADFASYFEILTVSSFAYATLRFFKNILNINFKNLGKSYSFSKNLQKFDDEYENNVGKLKPILEKPTITKLAQNYLSNVWYEKYYYDNRVDDCYDTIYRKVKIHSLFIKTLPHIYLTSAFFGLLILLIVGAEDYFLQNGNNYCLSLFIFEIEMFILYIYGITKFCINKIPKLKLKPVNILIINILFVFVFYITYSKIPDLELKYVPTYEVLIIIALILSSFAFIFHFLRIIQIKLYYQTLFKWKLKKFKKERNKKIKNLTKKYKKNEEEELRKLEEYYGGVFY